MNVLLLGGLLGSLLAPQTSQTNPSESPLPVGTMQWVLPSQTVETSTAQQSVHRQGERHVLFLNRCRGGLTIEHGDRNDAVNNVSTVGGGTFPDYPYDDESWEEVLSETRRIFAPYAITVTDEDPSPAPHDEAVVCGHPSVLGLGNQVGGVAPFSCGRIPSAITFTFPVLYNGDTDAIASTVAQEAAHSWGLEHLLSCNDPMTYLSHPWDDEESCWPRAFQDKDTLCGEYDERECDCGGTTQNSHRLLLSQFGPGGDPPNVRITSPTEGEAFETSDSFFIEVEADPDVTSVTLYANGVEHDTDSTPPFGPFLAEKSPDGLYDLYVEARDDVGLIGVSQGVTVYVTPDGLVENPGGLVPGEDSDLPPGYGYGLEVESTPEGCACATRGDGRGDGWGVVLLAGILGLRVRSVRSRPARA